MLRKCLSDGFRYISTAANLNFSSKRTFTRLLSSISNRPDEERIKLLGPDRSCAEWLLRNGAFVKWANKENWVTDYNTLPSEDNKAQYFIEEVDVDGAGIMQNGMRHFVGCNHVKRIRFHYCPYLTEEAFEEAIERLKHSLQHLELTSCGDITDTGLSHITKLSLLKTLKMRDLPGIRKPKESYDHLKSSLPECQIYYTDLKHLKK